MHRLLIVLGIMVWWMTGCTHPPHSSIQLSERVVLPPRAAVIFFVDGMDHRVFDELVAAGALPNMQKYFVTGGVSIEHAIDSMPSITYCNSSSIITGCFPGHHGILGNSWFDPETIQMVGYGSAGTYRAVNDHLQQPTLYEMLDDRFSVNVQCHTRRGVKQTVDDVVHSGVCWLLRQYSRVDAHAGWNIVEVAELAESAREWPTVTMFYFPGVDEHAHRHGVESAEYRQAIRIVDRAIGRVCEAIQQSPLGERTYFVLVSDHGHIATPPERSFAFYDYLTKGLGYRVHRPETEDRDEFEAHLRRLRNKDIVLITEESRRAALHLRGPHNWGGAPDAELLSRLLNPAVLAHPQAVELVTWPISPNRIGVLNRTGRAVIERRLHEGEKQYRLLIEAGDPLRYLAEGVVIQAHEAESARAETGDSEQRNQVLELGEWYSSREWLRATCRAELPDFVPQVMEMFDSPRAGDIVLFAAEDYSFDNPWQGAHGSCLAADMHVPFYICGPDIPAGSRIKAGRLVDLVPTLLELLGEKQRIAQQPQLDGVSLAGEILKAP